VRNTNEIQQAIRMYMDATGDTVVGIGEKTGVSHVSVVRWRSGQIKEIKHANWVLLLPLIAPYLNPDELQEPRTVVPAAVGKTMVPVLGSAAAAGMEPAVEPIGDYLSAFDEEEDWPDEHPYRQGYFCLRVEGDSMSPAIPHGAMLYVAVGEYPERGDIVVARLADQGEVVVKEYHRRNGLIELRAVNPDGQSYNIDLKTEFGRIVWMWPVLQARINLRRQRWERNKQISENGRKET
jgi:SOS-response transcriptional repressor LexA